MDELKDVTDKPEAAIAFGLALGAALILIVSRWMLGV